MAVRKYCRFTAKRIETIMMSASNPARTARRLEKLSALRPALAIVLGSGFQGAVEKMVVEAEISYDQLPGFPPVGVDGHAGKLALGHLGGTPVVVLSGRAHYYEGHTMDQVTFAVRTLAEFGLRDLLLTNAAGGINRRFRKGDFMILTDHINFMGANPLRGPAPGKGPRFLDLTRAYDEQLDGLMRRAAKTTGLRLRAGVYIAVSGPSYETPAEIRAFGRWGADAVGMSTVPEAIAARQCGLRVAALSCITNLAAGLGAGELAHEEVIATGRRATEAGGRLLENFAKLYGTGS